MVSPKPKQRKPQSEADFAAQKTEFAEVGPRINDHGWLTDNNAVAELLAERKIDRVQMLNACERAYFGRDYSRCLELISQAYVLFGAPEDEIEQLQQEFDAMGRKIKKSAKVERHVVELGHIKERCLAKMAS